MPPAPSDHDHDWRVVLRARLGAETLSPADLESVIEELAQHLESAEQELLSRGVAASDARARLAAQLDDVGLLEAVRRRAASRPPSPLAVEHGEHDAPDRGRPVRMTHRIGEAIRDLRFSARSLARERAFSAFVVTILALGIGANAAMFGIIDRLLLRGPEHVADAERLQRLYFTAPRADGTPVTASSWGYVTYALLRDEATTLDGVAAYSSTWLTVGEGIEAERIEAHLVTHGFFDLLGVRPALGRFFTAEEDLPPMGQNVVVLDHGFWRRRFGSDPAVIGRTTMLDGVSYVIVGVAPPGFTGAELRRADLWRPMALSRTRPDWPTTWRAQWLTIIGRLRPETGAAAASADAERIFRNHYEGGNAAMRDATLSFRPISFTSSGREPPEAAVSRWLVGVTIVVLLIACANVANLLLARASRRRREVAVRLALGASRWRIARLLLTDGLLLALLGCALGLLLAHWGGSLIRTVLLPGVAWTSSPVSGRVIAVSIGLAIVTGTLVALAPVLEARRLDLAAAIKSGSPQAGTARSPLRTLLILGQAAFSFVLLIGAGLFVRSLHNVTSLDLGFEPDRVLSATIAWPPATRTAEERQRESRRRRAAFAAIAERLRATPGVENAAIAVGTPFGAAFGVDLWVPGRDSIPDLGGGGPFVSAVSHGYFETTAMRLRRGRTFTAADGAGSERVVIVNEPMASALWPGEDPLAKCLQIFSRELPCARVVGVVAEVRRFALREPPAMQYWVPFGQEEGIGGSVILVRPSGAGDPSRFAPTLRRTIFEVEPGLLSSRIEPMRDSIDPLTRSWRLGATLFTIFGALALVIAATGLYSVITYMVVRRRHEFGIRMALGARSADIVRLVVGRGLFTVIVGLASGLLIAVAAGGRVAPLLFETSATDAGVIATATSVLLVAAVAACWWPAQWASRVDAAVALRAD